MWGFEFSLPVLFFLVFVFNVIPAFMPPTWAVLAYYQITQGVGFEGILFLAVSGAFFSTIGRFVLAKWSGPLVAGLFKHTPMKNNVDFAHEALSKKPFASFVFTFLYALSPFPSNAVFIIAGTAKLKLVPIMLGFFIGRVISYAALMYLSVFTIDALNSAFMLENFSNWIIDILGIAITLMFFMVDWKKTLSGVHGLFRKKQN